MSAASRYFPRAPRYVFRPQDQRLMRFKGMDVNSSASRALVRDLSESGLSFVVDAGETPLEGEILKIEFTLPGRRQIAWFASVARVESKLDWDPISGYHHQTVVGLSFRRLSPALTRQIQKSLEGRVFSEEKPDYDPRAATGGQIALFTALVTGAFGSFVVMALPPALWLKPFHVLFQ